MILQEPTEFRGLRFTRNPALFNEIERYIITDYAYLKDRQLVNLNDFVGDHFKLKPIVLYGLTNAEKDIPSFGHPLVNKKNGWIALDLRQMVSVNQEQMQATVRNDSEFQFALQRFVLSGMWAVGKYEAVYGLRFPHLVFGDWLASNITRKFGLTMGDEVRLAVLGHIFYACQFTNDFSEDDLAKLKLRLAAEIYTEALVDDVYQTCGKVDTIEEFCAACYKATNNIRVKDFDVAGLFSVVAGNWYGINAGEIGLTSLVHPPTWVAMVFASLTQRSFKSSYVTKRVDGRNKRGVGDEFLKELTHITSSYKVN